MSEVELHTDERELAMGCARGDSEALARLRREHLGPVVAAVGRLRGVDVAAAELESRLLEHLCIGDDGRPARIAEYDGRGSLRGFLQASATRLVLSVLRRHANSPGVSTSLPEAAVQAASLDVQAERAQRLEGLNGALRAAVDGLSVRDRNLLRQHYIDGLTTEQVARLYGVHRATAVRWLASAREAVLARTREAAISELGVKREEVEGLFDIMRSQLDLRLSAFLSSADGRAE